MTGMQDVIRVKVWLEGVELPDAAWSSCSVTSRRNGPASGQITMFPVPGMRSEDFARARIAIAWSNIDIRSRKGNDWPLLFDGEVMADGFSKSPSSRSVQFGLVGTDVYFEQAKLYFYDPSTGADAQTVNQVAMYFGNTKVEYSLAATGLDTVNAVVEKIRQQGEGKPLPSAMRTLFKDTLGSTNIFFDRARQDLKLDRRFGVPKDDFAALLYAKRSLFFTQIENGVAAREGDTPMMQIMQEIMQKFRYQLISNPQPTVIKAAQQDLGTITAQREQALQEAEFLCIRLFGVPPSKVRIAATSSDGTIEGIASGLANPVTRANLYAGAELSIDAVEVLSSATSTPADVREYIEDVKPRIVEALKLVRASLQRAASVNTTRNGVDVLDEDDGVVDVLSQYIMVPDTSFSSVPRCNVIFPNENNAYGIQRDYLREPTRMISYVPTVAGATAEIFCAPQSLGATAKLIVDPVTYDVVGDVFPPMIVNGGVLSVVNSKFGLRMDPLNNQNTKMKAHKGIDMRVPKGTPVFSVRDGVIASEPSIQIGGAGLHVVIRHNNGDYTKYMHLLAVSVKGGQQIKAGQQIGVSGGDPADGASAGGSSGAHLHFEYHKGSRFNAVDPTDFLKIAESGKGKAVAAGSTQLKSSSATSEPQSSVSLADGAPQTTDGKAFRDHVYLTPEEEVRGIVPIIDTSMDRTAITFAVEGNGGDTSARRQYLQQIVEAKFQSEKYSTRSVEAAVMPWSPRFVAGFPALIIDRFRPIIGTVESVTTSYSKSGNGNADTTVSLSNPRYWDEGDPFFWRNGTEAYTTVSGRAPGESNRAPDPKAANFPAFMLPSMFPTNSYRSAPATSREAFGGDVRNRPDDSLLQSLIGCRAIPYHYAERLSPVTGTTVAYNDAIPVLVKQYNDLSKVNHEAANDFVQSFTARESVSINEFMVTFLGCKPGGGGYVGPAFRDTIRAVVLDYVASVNSTEAFRG